MSGVCQRKDDQADLGVVVLGVKVERLIVRNSNIGRGSLLELWWPL